MTVHSTGSAAAHPELPQNIVIPTNDLRFCGACAHWRRDPDGLTHGPCGSAEAEESGVVQWTREDFGCRFFRPRHPVEYRAALVDAGVVAVFDALYAVAGRTRLPTSVDGIGKATRERLEIAVVRILQSAGVL